ncbi:MAG: hypothetical protein ACHP84_13360 [Caulobacterales bacterium]
MTRARLLAGVCLAAALAFVDQASAQVSDPSLSVSRNANHQTAAQTSGAKVDIYDYWNQLEAQGKLTPAAHEQLVQDAQAQLDAESAKIERSVQHSAIASNSQQLQQSIADFQTASKAKDTQGQVDSALKVNDAMVNGVVLPAHTEVTIIVDDLVNIQRDLLQKTSKAVTGKGAAAEQQYIAKGEATLDRVQRQVDAQLYQERVKVEQTTTALNEATPAQRQAVAAKINADIAAGRLVRTPDGALAPGPNAPQTQTPETPAPAEQATPPPPTPPPAGVPETPPAGDQTQTADASQTSTAPPASRPVHKGTIPGDASGNSDPSLRADASRTTNTDNQPPDNGVDPATQVNGARSPPPPPDQNTGVDPALQVPEAAKNPPPSPPPPPPPPPPQDSAAQQASGDAAGAAMRQALDALKDQPGRPPTPPPGEETQGPGLPGPATNGGTGDVPGAPGNGTNGQSGQGADNSQSPSGGPGQNQPDWQGPVWSPPPTMRRDGKIGMTDVLDDQPDTLAAIVEWVKMSPNGPGDGLGGIDVAGTLADQTASRPSVASAGAWQSFENGGTLTVAELAPIYAGYTVTVGQNGSSVMLVPSSEVTGAPSAVTIVPSLVDANVPSAVMTSLDLQPALCGR